MSDAILQYIDTGKKLNLRIEKLLATLYLSKFSGTVTVYDNNVLLKIVIIENKLYFDNSILTLSSLSEKSLLKIGSSFSADVKTKEREYNILEFIHKIIANIPKAKIMTLLRPHATEHFSIKSETKKLMFLYSELEPFIGIQRIEIFTNLKKSYRTIYFLLVTRFAGIVKSTEAEKTAILEKMNRTNLFDEIDKDDSDSKNVSEKKEQPFEEILSEFLDTIEKYKDIFHLFGVSYGFEEINLHKVYLQIVQKIHPDRLFEVSPSLKNRAGTMLQIVGENYELLKNPADRDAIHNLMKKYGPIKTRTDYTRLKEFDEAMFKGTALLRLGQYESASMIFNEIYQQTSSPDALEKKILSIWKKTSKWNDNQKAEKFPEIKEDIVKLCSLKDPELEVLFILVEIFEFLKMIPESIKILLLILENDPLNKRAMGMKKRIHYYESLNKEK